MELLMLVIQRLLYITVLLGAWVYTAHSIYKWNKFLRKHGLTGLGLLPNLGLIWVCALLFLGSFYVVGSTAPQYIIIGVFILFVVIKITWEYIRLKKIIDIVLRRIFRKSGLIE